MQLLPLTLLSLLLSFGFANQQVHQHLEKKQLAQGGGLAPATMAPSQYPIVSNVNKLVTIGGATTVQMVAFTQTFASTALGT